MTDAAILVLYALRGEAAKSGDNRLLTLCDAAEALYRNARAAQDKHDDLAVGLVQIKSMMHVPASTPAKDMRKLHRAVRDKIDEMLGQEFDTHPMEVIDVQ